MNRYLEKIAEDLDYEEDLIKFAASLQGTARAGMRIASKKSKSEQLVEMAFDANDAHQNYKAAHKKLRKFNKPKKIQRGK